MTPCPSCDRPTFDGAPCEPCNAEATGTLCTVVGHLVERYGVEGVMRLLGRFQRLESCDRIARDFEVSGERVRQWRNMLGTVEREWAPAPEMVGMAGSRGWT